MQVVRGFLPPIRGGRTIIAVEIGWRSSRSDDLCLRNIADYEAWLNVIFNVVVVRNNFCLLSLFIVNLVREGFIKLFSFM